VNGSEHENPEIPTPSSYGTPPPPTPAPNLPQNLPPRIQWGTVFRLASPLAIVTGVVSYLFVPIGLLLVLPISLKRVLTRYRPFHSGVLRTGQGAAMGAFTALLGFVAYLVFMIPTIAGNRGTVLDIIRKSGAQNPDPQAQQIAQWFTTNQGFVVFVCILLGFLLAIFLIAGIISGALLTRAEKPA